MLKNFYDKFKLLPESNKSMIFLMWIYNVGGIIGGLFVNIYIFQMNKDLIDVIYYNMIFFTTSFIGFSFFGYLMALYKKDIKIMYYISYIFFIISFIFLLFFNSSLLLIGIFAVIYGLGNGAFWCAVHTQELVHIEDNKRDIYSSLIGVGGNFISIVIPLLISFVFFVSSISFDFDPYLVLFGFLPTLYLISFLFIRNIESYIPSRITKMDILNFFNFKKYKYGLLYILGVSFYHGTIFLIGAVVSIIILKTEANVGLFEGVMSIISTVILIFIANKRTTDNRIKIMGYIVFFIFINYLVFSFNFNFYGYVIFTLFGIILGPLFRVSEHVYDLKIMDTIKYKGSDFYPAMILREFILWAGRLFVMSIMLLITFYSGFELEQILYIGLLLVPTFMFLAWISIYMHLKYEN